MRETFAFSPVAAGPVQPRQSGQTRGAQIVGGESRSGVVAPGPQTNPAPVAAGLGAFVEEIMRPHVQRRQQEQFFKGYTEAQSGAAISEISKSHGGFNKIFGPTSFEQGAAFYAGQTAISEWTSERYAEMDTLKRLPPEELAKVLAEKSRDLFTGNSDADQLVQGEYLKEIGPLTNAISKARYAWRQATARQSWSEAGTAKATTLQAAITAQAKLSAPSDGELSVIDAQRATFLSSMAKPHGMDDETYRKGLYDFMRQSMQDGNFYAVGAMRAAGIDTIFNDDERVKLEDTEHRYSQRVLESFMSSDAGFSDLAMAYEEARAHSAIGNPNDPKSMTPMQAARRLTEMNDYVRRRTGVSDPLFDFKDVKGEVRSITDLVVSSYKRAEDRGWQLEDRQFAADQRRQEREADNAATAKEVGIAWASGDVEGAMAGGIEATHFNRVALTQFRNGDYTGLKRAFTVSHYTSSSVKQDIAAKVEGSLDEQYGKRFEAAHQMWAKMYAANPGMTASYFGEYHDQMRAFDTLSRQVGPEAAYTRAFGDRARYSTAEIPPQMRKDADTAIKDAVGQRVPSSWNPLAQQYSSQAVRVMQNVTRERVAMGLKNSDTPPNVLAPEALSAAMADGSLQVAGGEAWRAAPGTKPFHVQLGLQQDEAGKVFRAQVDFRLKRAGFKAGINSTLDINYIDAPNGQKALHIIGRDTSGNSQSILVPMQAFKDEAASRLRLAKPRMTGKDNPLGAGRPISADHEATARGVILPSETLQVINGKPFAADRNFNQRRRPIREDWRSLPVKHPQYLK